ncbi:MAG: 2-oxoglutarate and iron-dependent oxygenase domain-containing protein, partial [Saprospiraceae bacterium]|nr:2-oxoglutarate and iron-dependent oxygenase domain-containing protein [Saprospiraceae bacterium]
MQEKGIPTVDLGQYAHGSEADKKAFVQQLGKAFHEVGFVAVVNHGVPKKLIDDFYAASKAFFALPEDVK